MKRFLLRDRDEGALRKIGDAYVALVGSLLPEADVQEVGSSAVPGLIGKQDIDIQALVMPGAFFAARDVLDSRFERIPDQLSTDDFQAYWLDRSVDVSLQLTIKAGPYDIFVPFRDLLRVDPDMRARYESLKRRYDGRSMSAYRQAKHEFITEALRSLSRP